MRLVGRFFQRAAALRGRAAQQLGRLPRFWRHFAQNLLVGVCIEVVVALGGGTGPVMWLENAALDAVMRLNADTEKSDGRPVQLFIDVDEKTWRSLAWGGGEPKTVPLERVADLIARAAELQPRYVLVDFLIEGAQDGEQEAFLKRIEGVLEQSPESRLLFVRGFRRPLERHAAQGVRPAYAVDALMAKHPQRVFAVAPNFVLSGGQVLRHWRLWESACYPLGEQGEGVWAVVPSSQLMIAALEAKGDIPWRLRFAEGAAGATPVAPANPDAGSRCMTDAGENLHAGYSARLADWQAGKWVQGHFGTCYSQGFFTDEDCARGTAPAAVLLLDEAAARADEYLASRVLFRQSDLAGRHEAALLRGEQPDMLRYGAHFGRIAAGELLTGEPPRQGPAAAALAKVSAAAEQGQLTVAVIGASYDESHDHHMTPLGLMPGPLVLVNAADSLLTVGVLQALGDKASWAITAATLLASALFAWLSSGWCRVFMLALVVLTLGPLSLWLIKQGIWLNIAAPLVGIYLDREREIFMERSKHRTMSPPNPQENT